MKQNQLEFRGVWVANPIPFTESDEINADEYGRHINFMIREGIRGLMPVSMVASGVQLSYSERLQVIKLTVDNADGRVAVFPMCYIPAGTKNTIEFMREIEDLGADGAYLPTPILWQCGPKAIYEHYGVILTNTNLPVILYSCPDTTGTRLPSEVVARLLDEFPDRVIGFKQHRMDELPFDIARLGNRIGLAPTCFDRYTLTGLKLGCVAQMTIGGAFVPGTLTQVFEKWEAGETREAEDLFNQYMPLFELPPLSYFMPHRDYYAGTYMYILHRMGFQFGRPRLPYLWPIPEDLRHTIDKTLEHLNLAGVGASA